MLTDRQIKVITWSGKDTRVPSGVDGLGLQLQVRRSSKTWILRRREGDKVAILTLGTWPGMTVSAAVAAAHAKRAVAVPTRTIGTLVERYAADVTGKYRRPWIPQGYADRAVLPAWRNRQVGAVRTDEVAVLVQGYAMERGARSAAMLLSYLKGLFRYASVLGWRTDNPATPVTDAVAGYKYCPRERVLSDDELRLLWNADHPNARLLRFLVLTGLRISEAQHGHRVGEDEWHIPANLSKNGRAHWVYLPPMAQELLTTDWQVSPTAVQSWTKRWCAREGIDPPFTPHDCRRTFATVAAQSGAQPFIIERCLNHTLQGVMGIYNRNEYRKERRAAARAVEAYVVDAVQYGL
jgi:integrase